MKIKPIYIYGVLAIAVVVVIIIASQQSNVSNEPVDQTVAEQNMPNDDIHKQFNSGEEPNKNNVNKSFRDRLDALKEAVEKNPGDTTALKQYADLLASAHMQKQSIDYYNKILKVDPKRIDVRFSLAYVYYFLGDYKDAEEQTNEILKIDPENLNAQYNLGAISASRGDKVKAEQIWSELAKNYPDKEIGIKSKAAIKKLNEM